MACIHEIELQRDRKLSQYCKHCPHIISCVNDYEIPFRQWREVNTKINDYGDSREIIAYKNARKILEKCYNLPKYDRTPKMDISNGICTPKTEEYTVSDFHRCLKNSSNRAYDNFFGYALSNDWEWFVTLTFDPKKTDRYSEKDTSKRITKFMNKTKENCPNLKYLLIPEPHENGAIHYHGFISNCTHTLTIAQNAKTGEPLQTKLGDPIFNLPSWKWGYSTIAVLPTDTNRRKVVNYCSKYMNKQCNTKYRQKKFRRSLNLAFKTKESILITEEEREVLKKDFGVELHKENEKYEVYRG